jgi:hypothetical protein
MNVGAAILLLAVLVALALAIAVLMLLIFAQVIALFVMPRRTSSAISRSRGLRIAKGSAMPTSACTAGW